MLFYPNERVGVFIDGYHIYAIAKSLGGEIDYRELRRLFVSRCHLIRPVYYGISVDDADYVATRPLTDWLQYNGFSVILRTVRNPADSGAILRERSRLDVEMAVGVLTAAETLDHLVIFTGDDAFTSVAQALKRRGKIVTIISTLRSDAIVVSDQLRRAADQFVDLSDLPGVMNMRSATPAASNIAAGLRPKRPRGNGGLSASPESN